MGDKFESLVNWFKRPFCREAVDCVDFQPDVLEIKNQRLPIWARYSVFLALGFMVFVVLWAWFSKVDVIVTAPGKLVAGEANIVMKPLERSVIKQVNVRIGDVVKEGDILITFDPTSEKAEQERLQHECAALRAKYKRLQAEYEGTDYEPGANPSEVEQVQLSIFQQRRGYYGERLNYFNQSISQLEVARESCTEMLEMQKNRLKTVVEIENTFKSLDEKGAAAPLELLQSQMSRLEVEGAVLQMANRLLEMVPQINSARASRDSFIQDWESNVAEEFFKTKRELLAVEMELEKIDNLINFVYLRAPCDAVVHEIASFSIGSAVREAEALITLIPLSGGIELEAEIRAMDIGKVAVGSDVRVKLSAYPFQKHGTLNGVVRTISEDTFQRQGVRENAIDTVGSYYRARIPVAGKLDNVKSDFRLIPGMEAQAEIKCGRRRILEYLIYPLIKAFDEAAREP